MVVDNQRTHPLLMKRIKLPVLVGLCSAVLIYFQLFYSLTSVTLADDEKIASATLTRFQLKSSDGMVDFKKAQLKSARMLFQQPTHYPWNVHIADSDGQSKLETLWKFDNNPNPKIILTQLYHVRHGKLYGWNPQQKLLRQHEFYNLRVRRYEQLIARSLSFAKYALANEEQRRIDPRVEELSTEPFPFLFAWHDFVTCREEPYLTGIPFFAFLTFPSLNSEEKCTPLATPTYEQWRKYQNIENSTHWDAVFQKQDEDYPWNHKIQKAVWRGAATGEKREYPNWNDLPRTKLVKLAVENPAIMDARFTGFSNRNESEKKEIINFGLMGSRMEMKDYQKYKAIIDIDGNSWSSRFADLLCMNSLVLKVKPRWMDYFFLELQPWVHYVPVHANMSNLVEMVTKVTSDDQEIQQQMRQIVINANDWCRSKMTATQLSIDMIWIMISYLQLLKKDNLRSNFRKWQNVPWNTSQWIEIPYNISA